MDTGYLKEGLPALIVHKIWHHAISRSNIIPWESILNLFSSNQ